MNITEQIQNLAVVPVVVLEDTEDALPLAKALCEGGLPCAEVTFRTDAAEESIKIMTEAFPDMLVGAGTVLTAEQVDQAVKAGAKFIVSPGFDPEIVDYCILKGYSGISGMYHTFRSGTGSKAWTESDQVFSGRAVWRDCSNQSACCSIHGYKIYANRRNQSEKSGELSF